MITLSDGRNELWQWDTNRKLNVDADCSQVHFSNKVYGRSIDVDVVNGTVFIPDILLQTDKNLYVWAFVGTPENGHTKISKIFKVNRRNKPADYVFTPVDQLTLEEIKEIAESVREDADNGLFKGDKGDAFTYEDFTEEQLAALKGDPGYTPVKGVDYFDGKDGVSVTHSWNGTALTVTSASGTSSADLKGEKGDPFVYSDFTAAQLATLKGEKGDPGYTPIKGKDYVDGKDGYTPVKGVDYTDGLDGIGIVNITSSRPVVDPEGNRYSTLYIYTERPDGTDSKRYSFQVQHGKNGVDGTKGEPPYVFTTTYTAKTSNIGSSYDIPIGTIDNSKKAVEKGDLLISNEGNLYRALSDDMAGATIIVGELLAVLKGEPGGVQTVNGVSPDSNGNVQIEVGSGSGVEVTAKPGQLIRVKEVDEKGIPTTWEAVPWGYTEGERVEIPVVGEWLELEGGQFALTSQSIGLEVGKTYVVNCDGTDYEVIGLDMHEISGGEVSGVVLGNLSLIGGEDTGEPFMAVDIHTYDVFQLTGIDFSPNHTFSIYANGKVTHPIPGELLPEGVPYCVSGGMVVLPECQPVFDGTSGAPNGAYITQPFELVIGENYTVVFNGTEYKCVCQDAGALADEFSGVPGLVNEGANLENNESLVFCILNTGGGSGGVYGFIVLPTVPTEAVTISIYQDNTNIHKLDNRCLDLEWLPTAEKIDTMVYEPNMITSGTNLFKYTQLPVGTNVAVMFDDVRYECVVEQNNTTGWFFFGNLSIVNAEEFPNTGEPFCVWTLYETGEYGIDFADGNAHKIAVFRVDAEYNKLPEEFLPESAATKDYVNEMLGVIENGTY